MREQAGARGGRVREQAIQSRPGRQASRAAARVAPAAIGMGIATRRGLLRTRAWAAPRVDRAGHAVQDELAPRVAASMIATARRIEPARRRRSRWPLVTAGAAVAAGGAAAAYLLSRRENPVTALRPGREHAATTSREPSGPGTPAAEPEHAHVT